MLSLQGGTDVWRCRGPSVMVSICQLSVDNRGPDHRIPAMGLRPRGQAYRPESFTGPGN